MQATRPLSERARSVLRWYEATKSVKQTADRMRCSVHYVYSLLHRTGKWALDPHRHPLRGKENEIRRLHLHGSSLSQLAEKFRVSKVAIFKAVRRAEKSAPRGIRKRGCYLPESNDVAARSAAALARASPDPREINRQIGERIRRRRHTLRWSRAKLATALKLTVQRIQVLETSGTGLTIGTLFALSHALDTTPWSFLGELPPPAEGHHGRHGRDVFADFTEIRATRKTREFLAAYDRIRSSAVRKQVRELVTLLAEE